MLDPLIGSARAAHHAAARALLHHGPRNPAARARLLEAARAAGHVWDAGHPVTAIHGLVKEPPMNATSLPLTPSAYRAAHADLPRDESYWDGLTNAIATTHSAPARASATDTYVHGWVHDLGTTVTAVLRPRAELQEDDDHVEVAPARPKLLAPR
ncbi:hypothetical protein OH723_31895 (plasmid) [Streptomyces albidoflavus]|uniref:hypothetical protein n=1 Tax=Streptomyces TaxID=1883 RepID=UPI001BE6926D|nr:MULTISPECIES: hypothetical protein [unclassified Streptomyces]MBT2876422.1 hypothetical protein [Streptomyces sp. McG6]MBT2883056.1 hypothetical protein [Streptomyces sp. McG5]MBT2889235.1 hypothetical protein [Streptomyces sp. McG2]WTC39969.1 hypothetical protein OH723_31895 [Streptomyces albidoflavus]